MRDRDISQCLKVLPNKYLILVHYMLSAWWSQLLSVFGHYMIQPGESEKVMVMTTGLMDLGHK